MVGQVGNPSAVMSCLDRAACSAFCLRQFNAIASVASEVTSYLRVETTVAGTW